MSGDFAITTPMPVTAIAAYKPIPKPWLVAVAKSSLSLPSIVLHATNINDGSGDKAATYTDW